MKVPGIALPNVSLSPGFSGDEMALVLQDSNLVLRPLSDISAIDLKLPQLIAVSNIPFLIMPGDGSANGCQFTGTNGAFTLSAAIIAGSGVMLAGCYAYLPANFGGSSRPAGFYWTEFSTDTAGKVYANTYSQIGTPQRPTSNTEFTENLAGWVTAPTTEIVIRSDMLVAGGSIGKNGRLIATFHQSGSTSGTKSYRVRDSASTIWFSSPTTTSPVVDLQFENICLDSHTKKRYYRSIGNSTTSLGNGPITSTDTSIDQYLSLSLQQSTSVSTPILESFTLTAIFGE